MGHPSTPEFRTLHALRIKGFASIPTLCDLSGQSCDDVGRHLDDLAGADLAQFRAARSLWQLTPSGRSAYPERLAADLAGLDTDALASDYAAFLTLNGEFKELCGEWQLRDGAINEHLDPEYDAAVVARLAELDARTQPVVTSIGVIVERFVPYAPRLSTALRRVSAGETNMFTGVMCGSYHDAWMELHEDLIVTQGIDRATEGSY